MDTPRELAKHLIKSYVLRGDSLHSLQAGQQGSSCSEYSACIGGYGIKPDKIVVSRFEGKEMKELYSLKELYNEIKNERLQLTLF